MEQGGGGGGGGGGAQGGCRLTPAHTDHVMPRGSRLLFMHWLLNVIVEADNLSREVYYRTCVGSATHTAGPHPVNNVGERFG